MECSWNNCNNVVLMDKMCSRHLKQQCAICFEQVRSTNSAQTKRLSCGHAFHLKCILQWYIESISCPICRTEQPNDPLIKFKNRVEDNMRLKYMDSIHSLEDELRNR